MRQQNENPLAAALKECRPLIVGAFAFSLVISLLNLAVPIYSMQVFDRVLSSGSKNTLIMLSVVVIGCLLFLGIITALRAIVLAQMSRWLDDKLSEEIVEKTIELTLLRPNIGSQPMRDLGSLRSFISSPTMGTILDTPWAIIFFVALFLINITIGLIVTLSALVLLGLAVLAQRWPSKLVASSSDAQVKSLQSLDAILRNAEVVRALGMAETATRFFRQENDRALEDGYRAGNMGTVIGNSTKTFRMGLQMLITGLGAWLVINGQMSMGAIIAVNILTGKALAPFDAAVAIYQGWTNAKNAYQRLTSVLDIEIDNNHKLELPKPTGELNVVNAAFQEPLSKRWLLNDVSLSFPAGSSAGIIGPSGSGKTTLSRLLVGVKEPTRGKITLDGASLDQWRADQLSPALGYLPQDVELFSGTIAQNIGRMDDQADDAEIVAAAKLAEVHDFILSMPDGYQTDIGENGSALSAGQRQRIGLARCFFGAPKVIVLDEPNSNLDTEGEQALVKALINAKEQSITVIVVAHRPSLLHHVDQIAVLKNGEVAMNGPTRDVMEKLASTNKSVQPLKVGRAG